MTTHRVTFGLLILTGAALLLSPVAMAQAPPPGSYLQSCTASRMSDTTLKASCEDSSGKPHDAALPDAWTCITDISNSNGQLQCHGGGFYTASCTGVMTYHTPEGVPFILASCKNFFGQTQLTSLMAPDSCDAMTIGSVAAAGPKARILNINGNLRCVVWFRADPSGHGNQDIIGKTTWTDGSTEKTFWTIDQPTITQPFNPFMTITFQKRDTVTLSAFGCSQEGAVSWHGWTDYTNQPTSGKYFGLAFLPGTGQPDEDPLLNPEDFAIGPIRGIEPVSGGVTAGINGVPRIVYGDAPNQYLKLGYVDDGYRSGTNAGYSDNGYYDVLNNSSGTWGGCVNVGPVNLLLEVDHPLKPSSASLPYSNGSRDFDVIFNQLDNNGLPLNPKWQSQRDDTSKVKDFDKTCGSAFSTPSQDSAQAVVSDLGGAAAGAALGSFAGPVGTALGALGGWLFGSDVVASTATTMDADKLVATCTAQPVSMDQFSSTSNWGSAILGAGSLVKQVCAAQPIRGHLNWQPVTYTGLLHFSDWSGVYPQDYDVNMSLIPGTVDDNGKPVVDDHGKPLVDDGGFWSGLTCGSTAIDSGSETYPYGGFLVEFDSQETVQRYFIQRPEGSWWHKFAIDALAAGPGDIASAASDIVGPTPGAIVSTLSGQGDSKTVISDAIAAANQLIGAPDHHFLVNAAVTGLMGVDGVHGHGLSELHPVFSMAIHIPKDEPTPTGKKEHWVFFIRNQGDEGNCSAQTHTLEPENYGSRDYYISLPWPSEKGKPPFDSVSVPPIKATPWAAGASVERAQSAPGFGTYLHFLSPPYSAPDPVPFFGFDGEVTLEYTYAKSDAPKTDPGSTPVSQDAAKDPGSIPKRDKDAEAFDAEDFPWKKIIGASTDPAVTAHLKKLFTQRLADQAASAPLPEITESSGVSLVAPRTLPRDARLPHRTHELVNVKKQRENDELSRKTGNTHQTFQALDSQHVFFLGTDGILRFKQGPFNSTGGDVDKSTDISKVVDQDVLTFAAVSQSEVLKLAPNGVLYIETAPFDTAADGTCVKGFVWRAAYPNDHVCVPPSTRDEAAADNAAGPRHVLPAASGKTDTCTYGYVWRHADASDHICVTPDVRSQVVEDNKLGRSRIAATSAKKFLGWPVANFQAVSNGNLMVLDANGKLFSVRTPFDSSSKPTLIAQSVRAFQALDNTHTLVLTTDDRLQTFPTSTGSAAAKVYDNVWAFQEASDGSLFVIDGDDTLWSEQPLKQLETNVRKVQAIDANTLFILREDGKLSLRKTPTSQSSSGVTATVASDIRDFQALDAQTVFVLDQDGKLWVERGNFGPETPTRTLVATKVR